jgi:hypothetical protein
MLAATALIPGDHWVTIDGNHVLISESQGTRQPTQPGIAQVPPRSSVTILGKSVRVTYRKGTSGRDRDSDYQTIRSAANLLNQNASSLTDEEKKSVANIKTIDVDPTASRSYTDVSTGTFHANAGQLREGTARFATDIAHEGTHVMQWQSGRAFTGKDAEREATYFQIGVGNKIGLSEEDTKQLRNYAEHVEDYKEYWGSRVTHPKQ